MDKPDDISGYRSRAINAGYAYTASVAPVAGDGVSVSDGPLGRSVSVVPRRVAELPQPWQVDPVVVPAETDAGVVDWHIRIHLGMPLDLSSAGVIPPITISSTHGLAWTDGGPDAAGLDTVLVSMEEVEPGDGWRYLSVELDDSAAPQYGFAVADDTSAYPASRGPDGVRRVAIAQILYEDAGDAPRLRQLHAPYFLRFGGDMPLPFDLRETEDGEQQVYIPESLRGTAVRFNGQDCHDANSPELTSADWQPMSGPVAVSVKWNSGLGRYEWQFGAASGAIVSVAIGTAAQPRRHGAINVSLYEADDASLEYWREGSSNQKPWVFQFHEFREGLTHVPDSYDIVIRDNAGPEVDYIEPADLAQNIRDNIIDESMVATLDAYDAWQPHVRRQGVAGTYYVGDPSQGAGNWCWISLEEAIAATVSTDTPLDLKAWIQDVERRLAALEG